MVDLTQGTDTSDWAEEAARLVRIFSDLGCRIYGVRECKLKSYVTLYGLDKGDRHVNLGDESCPVGAALPDQGASRRLDVINSQAFGSSDHERSIIKPTTLVMVPGDRNVKRRRLQT